MELTIGRELIDKKYQTICRKYYKIYDECMKDTFGDLHLCKTFRKKVEKCEEQSDFYEEVFQKLNIERVKTIAE